MAGLDSEYLMALARLKTVENRATLAEIVLDLFSDRGEFLTDFERASMSSILRRIIGDIEGTLREALCDALKDVPEVSGDTRDQLRTGEVAYALLSDSPALHAEDLIEVVRHRYLEHRLTLSLRENSDQAREIASLSRDGEWRVTEVLLHNPKADIARKTMEYLVEQSKKFDTAHEPVVRQEELGPDLAQRMFLWVSAALRQHIVQKLALDEMIIDELMERVVSKRLRAIAESRGKCVADQLADELATANMIEPATLLASLAQGEVSLFIALFARATGLRGGLVRRLLFEPGGEGLAIACKAIAVPPDVYARLFTLSRMTRQVPLAQVRIETKKAIAFYELLNAVHAAQVLRKWRLSPNYAAAVRGLQLGVAALQ